MKRAAFAVLALICALCVWVSGYGEDHISIPMDFQETLRALYGQEGGQILSASVCGKNGAAVVQSGEGCFLTVLTQSGQEWQIVFENHAAACEKSRVYLDTDTMLILNTPFEWNDQEMDQYYFTLTDGVWMLSSTIRYEGIPDEFNLLTESCASLSDGWMLTEIYYTDQEGNVLASRKGDQLPDVLTDEERSLAAFSGFIPPINGLGYLTDDSMAVSDGILRRLFSAVVPPDYTYADGLKCKDGLQFIADKADGTRVLLCCAYAGKPSGWQITESAPLPNGTQFGIENFTTALNLGLQGFGVSIGKNSDGTWGADGLLTQNGEWFDIGPCWASEGGFWWNASPSIGTAPWHDITKMAWSLLPQSLEEARSLLDPSGFATPNNPNPQDRLHLRTLPRKDSQSLGKYYNGTPLRVLGREGEWTQVRIGETVGYMMTKYLLFGEQINAQPSALTGKTNRNALTDMIWDGSPIPEKLTASEVSRLLIIGVIDDTWYLMWDPETDRCGRIRQDALWDGNG